MKFQETSTLFSLNKNTYSNLRWIAYFGQLTAILTVQFLFEFKFHYFNCILIVFIGKLILIGCSLFIEVKISLSSTDQSFAILISYINITRT